ncbi:MAG: adenylate/guanylate cyclase domain-containing protein [Acidimicrobiales bacterium]
MAARPTGTVTFLFTDIEQSTRLWEASPGEMERALGSHDQILRSSVHEAGGVVFATGGDGFAAAFNRAEHAVAAAVRAQRRLANEPWPTGAALRVRMGLHTGEAHERDGDYYGPAVNRAARLMAAGHGGQILLSGATVAVIGKLPDGAVLVDLGEHRLSDVSEPLTVHMTIADGLATRFPPLRTVERVPGNLPTTATSFVGRFDEYAQASKLLQTSRLLTIIGPGGIGKTRLALHIAADHASQLPDGVWFIDLLPIVDGQAAAAAAAPLCIQLPPDREPQRVLVEALAAQRLLLVLDNCEHVREEAATLVDAIISSCPGVTVLATSREPLGVPGEQLFPLPPMGESAADLFIERARLASPSFEPTRGEHRQITELCERLDGLPLAIELAAGRVRSHSVEELLDAVNDRFRILRAARLAPSSRPERHSSMRRTIEWSYDLLTPSEQVIFDRCSVFAGPFTRAAAAAICADSDVDDVDDALDSLIDKSLITVRPGTLRTNRLDLLDSMRAFGRERLNERREAGTIAARHARWYAEFAYRTGVDHFGEGEAERVGGLLGALDNCRSAFHQLCQHDLIAAEQLCAGFVAAGWTMTYEPFEWSLQVWRPDPEREPNDIHLWYCATVAWAALSFHRSDVSRQVRAHLAGIGADPAHPAVIDVDFAWWTDLLYHPDEHPGLDLRGAALDLIRCAEATGSAYRIAMAAQQTAWQFDIPEALERLDEGIRRSEADGCLTVPAMMRVVRALFLQASDPTRARTDLDEAMDMAALAHAPFVITSAVDALTNSRLSDLDRDARLAANDGMLLTWHRAGDETRMCVILASVLTLLDQPRQDADIVYLSAALDARHSRHNDPRTQRQVTAAAQLAAARLGPAQVDREQRAGQRAAMVDVLTRARQAIAAARRFNLEAPPESADERPLR